MPENESFIVKYDGAALATHQIDVHDLAPALLGLADALQEANRIINGDETTLSVKVKTGVIEPGSVITTLYCEYVANPNLLTFLTNQLTTPQATALANLTAFLGLPSALAWYNKKGLIQLLLKLKNRTIKSTKKDEVKTVITLDNDEELETEGKTLELLSNYKVRKGLSDAISRPLSKEGIEDVEFKKDVDSEGVKIEKKDAVYFDVPEGEEVILSDNEVVMSVQIIGMYFSQGNKWTFSDGKDRFTAPVNDDEFLSKIQKGEEVFRAGDRLSVRMRMIQKQKMGFDIKVSREILKVLEHNHRPTQINLPMGS
jgi:hypothetical protein